MEEEEKKMKKQRTYKTIMLVVLTCFITFMITSLSMYTYYEKNLLVSGSSSETVSTSNLEEYVENIKLILERNYLWNDEINEEELITSAVEGYVSGLNDKYTEYISKEDMEEFTEEIVGNFTGIGIYMIADEDSQNIVVYYPIPESPAEKAGVKAGDIIKSVDGVEYAYEDFSTLADAIRGEEGTKVKLVVERDGKEIDFEITRAKVNTNPITTELLDDDIGYVSVPSFDSETSTQFKEKVDELVKKGAKSLIIDLRNNGGGIVDEATGIADYLLPKGKTIMTTKDNQDEEEITESENDAIYDMPVVVLVNENTASASEILAGALQDNDRATIIGTKTYGKGVIQTVYNLNDGSGLKITTAEYYTPNGNVINGIGLTPDIEVELPDSVTSIYSVDEDDDTQLQKAIKELK